MAVRVSVIVPAHNAARTLDRTLSSLRAQAFREWEAIVVDDGSTDHSADIAQAHGAADSRIRLLRQAQAGAAAARNAGLDAAGGDWIQFLDADDTLAHGHLGAMLQAASAAPSAELLHCGWRRVVKGEPWLAPHPAPRIAEPMVATAQGCPFAIHAALTRRDRIVAAGKFDPALRIAEDWDLWQRLARSGVRFQAVPGLIADVHVESDSLSSDSARHLSDGLKVIRRGHAADPRLPGNVPFAAGAPADEFPAAAWHFALWVAAAGLGRGADPVALLRQVDLPPPDGLDAFVLAGIVIDGLSVGIGPGAGPLDANWPRIGDGVTRLCGDIGVRAGSEAFGDQITRSIEAGVAETVQPGEEARIGRLASVAIELTEPLADRSLPNADRVRVTLLIDGKPIADCGTQLSFGMLSSARQLALAQSLPDTAELRQAMVRALVRRGPFALGLPPLAALKQYARLLLSSRNPHRHRHASLPHEDVRELFFRALPTGPAAVAADGRFAAIVAEERAIAELDEESDEAAAAPWVEPDYTQQDYWEGLFAKADPWGYRNDYETLKYEQTLDLIRDVPVGKALEIACAEGEFTRRLAAHAGHVLATDIAPTAVARAAQACADLPNCSFQRLDLLSEAPPESYDLIVASEVLYYLEPAAMRAFVAKVERHLNPGGIFLTAHANLLVDEPDRTGFGWPHHFGAKGIGSIVLENGAFVLETELWTPVYRIMRFRKATGEAAATARRIVADMARNLPERVASQVRWRGGREAPPADAWHEFPVLMYHRLAADGPAALARWRTTPAAFEAQLIHLREAGWQGVSLARLGQAVLEGIALPERSVVLTFDDATRDFLDHAVPLLHRHGFPATLFVPSGHVGGAAIWDAAYGEPAPLLDWDELRMLRDCDVAIGAHGVTHRQLPELDAETLVRELAGSRFRLEAELQQPVTSMAYPFGALDPLVRDAAFDIGYKLGFTCFDGRIAQNADPMVLKRREVVGGIEPAQFAALLDGS